MKRKITNLLAFLITLGFTNAALGQNITMLTPPSSPTDCSNTIVDVDALQLCINHLYNGYTVTVTGNTIVIDLFWTNASPICLGALAFISENISLGQLAAGNYSVEARGFFNGSQNNSMIQNMTITSCCPVTSIIQGPTNVCLGDSILLINNSTNSTSSYWAQGTTSISNSDSLALSFTTTGTYSYDLVATDGNCNASSTHTIIVSDYPNIDLGPDTTLCAGEPLVLNAMTSGATAYSWNTGANGSNLNVSTAGTYSVIVNNNSCASSDTIVVNHLASPTFDLGMNTAICQGDSILLDATVNQSGVNYLWSNGSTSPTINVTTSDTYSVTVTNSSNCSSNDLITVTVQALPMPDLGSDTTLCTGSIQLYDLANSSNNYLWSTGETMASITVDSSGTYSLTSTSDIGCVGTDSILVTYDIPNLDLGDTLDLVNSNPLILDAQNPGATYAWNNGETTQTISIDSSGTYSVTVTNAAGCATISSVVVVNTTNTNTIKLAKIKVYPNPAINYIIIENPTNNLQNAKITNAFGQLVKYVNLQQSQKIIIQDLTSGFYFIQFENNKGQVIGTTKFVKE